MITPAIANSFKRELLQAVHNFDAGGDVFKLALYTSAAELNKTTTSYSATNEIGATGSYVAGGGALTSSTGVDGDTATVDFADVSFTNQTMTTRGGLIYNSTKGNRAVLILDWGSDKSCAGGTFGIGFPAPDAANAVLRLG